jgi:hypothetical protein
VARELEEALRFIEAGDGRVERAAAAKGCG